MIKNMKLTNKILVAISIVILGMGIISIFSYLGFKKIGLEIEEISEYQIPINSLITELEKDILEEEILTYKLIIACVDITSTKFKQVETHILKLEEETEKTINKTEAYVKKAILHNKDIKTKNKYKEFLSQLKILKQEQQIYKKMLQKFDSDVKLSTYNNLEDDAKKIEVQLNKMDENIIHLIKKMNHLLINSTTQAKEDEIFILQLIKIVFAFALIISLIITYYLARYIKKSISQFQDGLIGFFNYLNKESIDVKNLEYNNNDEIGIMSQVINKNIEKTKRIIEEDKKVINETVKVLTEFEKGDLCKRVTCTTSNESLNQLTNLLNNMGDNLEKNIENVLDILEEYSNNNFLNKVQTIGIKEHLLNLANGINDLSDSITSTLIENKKNGQVLQESSSILRKNVNIFSTNSTEATASLEETAAALEEITNTMQQNTQNTNQVTSYATQVASSAKNGEKLSNETMDAMEDINQQVLSINEAILIIDQIAFQTNILSLNAAVEAATAGEAGKGFAVVAGEVRNLATRSAQAAKEIKLIVENATQKAQTGKTTTENMLKGYQELNIGVNKTLELIQNIDKSSQEQQTSVEQINDAISQLDQQTQKNSAIALETNEIAIQTQELSNLIIEDVKKKKFRE